MAMQSIKSFIKRHPYLYNVAGMIKGYKVILADYHFNSTPRYGHGKPPHPLLYEIVNKNRGLYEETLNSFLDFESNLLEIQVRPSNDKEPFWLNNYIHPLDAVALYCFVCQYKPKNYFEIGSGNSTKFARAAITDHGLPTIITSIDPEPRAQIETICDNIIRDPIEDIDIEMFNQLGPDDILFIDSSHRSFMNSDVTAIFLDVLPRLKAGVLVQFHDILLPYDYYPTWKVNYYNEQYLLAVSMLSNENRFAMVLPNYYISQDPELIGILDPIWQDEKVQAAINAEIKLGIVGKGGHSFWVRTT